MTLEELEQRHEYLIDKVESTKQDLETYEAELSEISESLTNYYANSFELGD